MGLYERLLLPRIVSLTCSTKPILRQRAKVVPLARGRVLEVGFGSGLNLPFYDAAKVQHVWALDPSPAMWKLAEKRLAAAPFQVRFLEAPAHRVPLEDASADTIVVTYTLCTMADPVAALAEMRRVLRREGELLFSEHGAAPDERVRRWQQCLNPIWSRLGGGCNLNRPIPALIEQAGFRLREVASMYIPGWKPASFTYWGVAVREDTTAS